MSDRGAETNCYTGRGEFYQGSLAVTKKGVPCKSGTFCRNPTSNTNKAELKIAYHGQIKKLVENLNFTPNLSII